MKRAIPKIVLQLFVILSIATFAATINLSYQQPVFADHVGEDSAAILTNDLLALVKQYLRAEAMGNEQLLGRIKEVIEKRKGQLLALLDANPDAVGRLLLPPQLVAGLPQEIRELLEAEIEFEGQLQVLIANNFDAGTSKTIYELTDSQTNNKYLLHFAGAAFDLSTGVTIKGKGTKIDNHLLVAAEGSTITGGVQAAAAYPLVSGDQKTIVMLVNFSDASVMCAPSACDSAVFNTSGTSTNTYYRDSSFDYVSFSGDVAGPLTIPYSKTSPTLCNDYNTWANLADAEAIDSGVVLSNYKRKLYVVPAISCGWAGLSYVGGNPSRSWVMGSYCSSVGVISHELGHALGMYHASSVSSTGSISEYGDGADVMGGASGLKQQNAPHKAQMGWIPSEKVQVVSGDATYTIDSVENRFPANPQALKIHKNDTNEDYYFSYRQPIGFDSTLTSPYTNTTNLHRWRGSGNTYYLNSLGDGISFTDTTNGITVKQLGHTNSQSTVSVTFGAAVCSRTVPLISVSPASSTGPEGATLRYMVSVTNQNSPACPASNYQISSVLPAGWADAFSPSNISLSPSTSASASWDVTSASGAPDASYIITAKATDIDNAAYFNTKDAAYVVFTDTVAPTVTVTSPLNGSTVSGKKVNIAVTAADSVSVQRVEIYIDGILQVTDTTSPYGYSWNTVKAALGAHTIFAKAYDSSGNVGTSSTITVNLSSSGKGGGPR